MNVETDIEPASVTLTERAAKRILEILREDCDAVDAACGCDRRRMFRIPI